MPEGAYQSHPPSITDRKVLLLLALYFLCWLAHRHIFRSHNWHPARYFELVYRLGLPWIALLFPIPEIALLPVFIILLEVDEGAARIATIASGVLFPTVFCMLQGVRSVPPKLIEMGAVFGLTRVQQLHRIVMPGSLAALFLSFRLTTAIALILLVSAEMLGANYGIGAFILGAGAMALMDQMLAGVLVLSLLGLMLFGFWAFLENKVLHWRE